MYKLSNFILLIFLFVFPAHNSFAQVVIQKKTTAGENVLFLQELAVLISEKDGMVKIETVLPISARPEEYKDLDIKEDDEILMVNAKRIKSVDDFNKIHEELEIEETIKMGIRRGEEMFIVEFKKIDPENLPNREMRIIRTAEPGAATIDEDKPGVITEKISITASENIHPVAGTGLLFEESEKQVKISHVLPHMKDMLGDLDIQQGDVLLRVNDTVIDSFEQFRKMYESLKIADDVKFSLKRGDKKVEVLFKKPKEKGNIIIKK